MAADAFGQNDRIKDPEGFKESQRLSLAGDSLAAPSCSWTET